MAQRVQGWRKLAGSAWGRPLDPQFYGDLELDAGAVEDYLARARELTGDHLTVTHLVGRAVAHGLAEVPQLRVRLAHGREYPRESVDVFFIVTAGDGQELTGVKVSAADRKSAVEIAREVGRRCAAIQVGQDADLGRGKALLARLPPGLLRVSLRLGAWLTSDLNLDLSGLGLPRQAFGGAMITSVGMWGISHAYSPLAHYYRVPVLVLVGAITRQPVADGDRVVVRPVLNLTATFDHRYVDGYHAAKFARAVQAYLAAPAEFEPALPSAAQPGAGQAGAGQAGAAQASPGQASPGQASPGQASPGRAAALGQSGRGQARMGQTGPAA
jgi:2-oxoacid dehydrogenases acyltransferase (catalytic domain)